jgi:hypothetical protein
MAWLDHAAAVDDAEAKLRAAKRDLAFAIVALGEEGWAR